MLGLNIDKSILQESVKTQVYDIAIVGAGPAGLTAAVYTSRGLCSTVLIEKLGSGGQAAITDHIENYPGFPDGINGFELSQKMEEQATRFGSKFEFSEINKITKDEYTRLFTIHGEDKSIQAKAVIIATGTSSRMLGVKGESDFMGRGISTCATCDAAFYREKVVAVIGGGDSAVDEGLYLTKFAKKVIVIHRRDSLRAVKILQKRAMENPKMEFIWDTVVEEVLGENKIQKLKLRNLKTGVESILEIDGMFLYIGLDPNTVFLDLANKDEQGYVITDEAMRTNVPGLFAAGDCRKTFLRQVATAVGDGAVAAVSAQKYLEFEWSE